ncbi:MAG: hypothetical protein DRR00_20220, partial [Candidatus Parabeggiatoa sp. nov. 3]
MGNENHSTPNNADNQPQQIPHNNSLVIGAMSSVILIVIVAGFTSLLNNKKISALEIRSSQLEASLQVLQKETATSMTTQPVFEALKEEKAASIKQPENALNDKAGLKIEALDAQLQTLKQAVTVAQNRQDEQLKALAVQVTQLETTLKADLKVLAQEQNDKLNGLEAQLQTVKAENTVALNQQGEQFKALSHQVTQQETAVGELTTAFEALNDQ